VVARRGLSGARPVDVAREAGVSEATIYAYFPTQEAMIDAVLASQAFEHDPDLLFRRELPSGPSTELPYSRFARLLLLLRHIETLLEVHRTP